MKKVDFRLESLLQLRIHERDQQRAEVAKAYQAMRIVEDQIQEKQESIQSFRQELQKRLTGVVGVDDLLSRGRHELFLTQEVAELQSKRMQIMDEANKREQQLLLANQEVKRLEKLKERCLQESQDILKMRLQNDIDETAGIRYWLQTLAAKRSVQ